MKTLKLQTNKQTQMYINLDIMTHRKDNSNGFRIQNIIIHPQQDIFQAQKELQGNPKLHSVAYIVSNIGIAEKQLC